MNSTKFHILCHDNLLYEKVKVHDWQNEKIIPCKILVLTK